MERGFWTRCVGHTCTRVCDFSEIPLHPGVTGLGFRLRGTGDSLPTTQIGKWRLRGVGEEAPPGLLAQPLSSS